MKNALKVRHILVITIILCITVLAFFLVSVILEQGFFVALPYKIIYALVFVLFVLLFVAFVSGDLRANKYRRKNKLWAGPLPEEVKQSVWNIRTPWLISALLTILLAIIYSIFFGF